MKKPSLDAMVGMYRPHSMGQHVRITGDGCVASCDMFMLKAARTFQFAVDGLGDKPREFVRLNLNDEHLLADTITGTIYRERDGFCLSGRLRLKVNAKVEP